MNYSREEKILGFILIISIILVFTNHASRILSFTWLFIGIFYILKNKGYKKSEIEKYVLIYFLSQGLSLIWAKDFLVSSHEYYRHLYALIPIFFISQIPFLKKIKIRCLDFSFIILTIYYFIYVNLQYFKILNPVFNDSRIVGFSDGSIVKYAYIAGILAIYSFYKIIFNEKKWIVINVMNIYLIILTEARGAWLGIIGSYVLMLIFYKKDLKKLAKNSFCFFSMSAILIYIFKENIIVSKYINRFKSIGNITTDTSNTARLGIWKDSILKFKKSNYMGLGYKNNLGYYFNNHSFDHSHSDYFYILSSSGIIGIIGYVFFLVGMIYKSLKNIKDDIWLFIFGVLIFLSIYGVVEVLIQTSVTLTATLLMLSFVSNTEEKK